MTNGIKTTCPLAWRGFQLEVPFGWAVCPLPKCGGIAIIAIEAARYFGTSNFLSDEVSIEPSGSKVHWNTFARKVMARRVPVGVPEIEILESGERTIAEYGYTDGVNWLVSTFFPHDNESFEITCARPMISQEPAAQAEFVKATYVDLLRQVGLVSVLVHQE